MKPLMIALAAAALSLPTAYAQQLKVATGSATGTYSKMLKEASSVCGSHVAITEQNTSGSMENMNLLTGNQVNSAFVQTDVLYYRGRTEDLGNIKTLLALHPEEVHLLAPAQSGLQTGGKLGTSIGAKPVVFSNIKDLAGYSVGAVGGSFITAQVIRIQSEITYNVVEYPGNKELLAALAAGQVQAALMVGGSPLGAVAELKGNDWKLLSLPEDVVAKLKNVYRPARLNYAGIRQMGVPTVATDALLVTREYKTPKFTEALGKFRGCVLANLDEFKETTGMHPKWQAVDGANKGKWPYYELPAVVTVTGVKK